MPGYFDGFGRRGRFGIQTAPAPAMPYMDAPRTAPSLRPMDQGPTQNESPNINTPGGYATSLRQAGVSSGYATKLALQRDRAQQGSMNTYTPRERADIYSAPMTGTAMFSPIRQGMEAAARGIDANTNFITQTTAPAVAGMNAQNDYANIRNQYAGRGFEADIGAQTARTDAIRGDEYRSQREFDLTSPYFGPARESAIGRVKAETGKIGAETNAIDRDYELNMRRYEDQFRQMQNQMRSYEAMIRAMQQQVNTFQRAAGQNETAWPDGGAGDQQAGGQLDYRPGRDGGQQTRETLPYDPRGGGGAQTRETLPIEAQGKRTEAIIRQYMGNSGGGPAQISSDAEYDALPSGTVFIGPDGKTRRKP